jgi:hypothetical protein
MHRPISLTAIEDVPEGGLLSTGSSAPELKEPWVRLRFRLMVSDEASLEALLYARRSMLREERTLGVEEGEPLLEDAEFSVTEIQWRVPGPVRERCVQKLGDLVGRANRALEQISALAPVAGPEMRRQP